MAALTSDSKAPLKDVKKLQFGILGPDELVRVTFICTRLNTLYYSSSLLLSGEMQ